MQALNKLLDSVRGATGKLPSLPDFNHKLLNISEQVGVALAAAFLLGLVERYVPFYVTLPALMIGGGIGAWFAGRFKVGVFTFLGLSAFYFCLGQPIIVLALAVLLSLGAAVATFMMTGTHSIGKRLLFSLLGGVAALLATLAIYYPMLVYLLPAVAPLTVWLYNISPALVVAPSLLVIGYCTMRQPADQRSWFWTATPAVAFLFCVYNWSPHSYFGDAVNALVAISLSVFGFMSRPTETRQGRARTLRSLAATSLAGMCFVGLFTLSNEWDWLYKFNMATALQVTDDGQGNVPETNNTRLVPKIAALDFCAQQNPENFVEFSEDPHPVVRVDQQSGDRHVYWQCLRHPTRLRGHLLYATGGMDGAVLADAGERGKFGAPLESPFIFGDKSAFVKGAFVARHPGSQAQSALVATDASGDNYILVPYVSRVMQVGAMIPDLGGVMAISQSGFIRDFTPGQAAARFPNVALFPAELARQYADLWGERSSLFAWLWSGEQFEVSEFADQTSNRYPFWQDFKGTGLRGTIPFEKAGKQSNAMVAIGLFDPASLQMTVYHTEHLHIPGPKQTQGNPGLTRPGLFGLQTTEALLVVHNGRVFWNLALLQPDKQNEKRFNHGYALNILVDGNAQDYCDVVSTARLNECLARADLNRPMQDLGQQLIAPGAPVTPSPAQPPAR